MKKNDVVYYLQKDGSIIRDIVTEITPYGVNLTAGHAIGKLFPSASEAARYEEERVAKKKEELKKTFSSIYEAVYFLETAKFDSKYEREIAFCAVMEYIKQKENE